MRKPLAVLAVISIAVGLGAVVVAASIPRADGTINGCRKTSNGDLIVIDSAETCPSGYTALNWNQTGASGFQMVQAQFNGISVEAGQTVSRGVNCPTGTVATGGSYGFTVNVTADPHVYVSATDLFNDPVGSNGGFVVQITATGTETLDIGVKAACMDAAA